MRRPIARGLRAGLLLAVSVTWSPAASLYYQSNLVSDIPGLAANTDPNLVNPWGISSSATSPFWVSDAGTDKATLYNSSGTPQALVVSIPPPPGGTSAEPTGQVFNGGTGFAIGGAPARFLFATTSGTIAGWNAGQGTTAAIMVDHSGSGDVYTGLASASSALGDTLYAADFAHGTIDVFDSGFNAVSLSGSFVDPTLPSGYSPFNIQNVGGELYVIYALVDPSTGEETKGAGLGFVDVYNTSGVLQRRFFSQGVLNAPWGVVRAPSAGFGDFSGMILIGNFGDGTINAFDPATGAFQGTISGFGGTPLVNEGLWGLKFGNGGNGGDPDRLYFAAGIEDEEHGLFGSLQLVPEPRTWGLALAGLAIAAIAQRRRRRS